MCLGRLSQAESITNKHPLTTNDTQIQQWHKNEAKTTATAAAAGVTKTKHTLTNDIICARMNRRCRWNIMWRKLTD